MELKHFNLNIFKTLKVDSSTKFFAEIILVKINKTVSELANSNIFKTLKVEFLRLIFQN